MPIPAKISPAPKQSQVYFQPGTGLSSLQVSVPRKEIQKTNGAASQSNSLVASGTGTITVGSVNLVNGVYTVVVPINLPTPLTAQTPMSLVLSAPTSPGIQGISITSLSATPLIFLAGSATPIGASTIPRGQTIRQFAANVTLQYSGNPQPGNITITCQASLVTTGG